MYMSAYLTSVGKDALGSGIGRLRALNGASGRPGLGCRVVQLIRMEIDSMSYEPDEQSMVRRKMMFVLQVAIH